MNSEKVSFYAFITALILSPLVFWPSPYFSLDLTKTIVIALGVLVSAICLGLRFFKERKLTLPPKGLFWTGTLLVISLLVSALVSIHVGKSLFGQGFEVATASFIILTFLAGLVVFDLVVRQSVRSILFYASIVSVYIILFVFQLLRLIFGPSFVNLSILNSTAATIFGTWTSFGLYSAVVSIVTLVALMVLPLSRRLKIFYGILSVAGFLVVFVVGNSGVWFGLALVFLGFTVFMSLAKSKTDPGSSFFRKITWFPAIVFLLTVILAWRGTAWSTPVINSLRVANPELTLPWQMTVDVVSNSIKNYPVFGIGPNNFSKAYLAYKPDGINQTDAWAVEFSNGFSLILTLVAGQGLVGAVLWVIFFVFLGIVGTKALRNLPTDPIQRFIVVSSFASTGFLWFANLIYVPSHVLLFLTLVMTGIFSGSAVAYGVVKPFLWSPAPKTKSYRAMVCLILVGIVAGIVWGIVYIKKTVGLAYFGAGIHQLNLGSDFALADSYFKKALSADTSDVYFQGRAEASMMKVGKLAAGISADTNASSSQAILNEISSTLNSGLQYAYSAIDYDPTNYYNYISEARVSGTAAGLRMQNAYESAVRAYGKASSVNPYDPSIYLSLSKLYVSQNKLDEALSAAGSALRLKNNYLDAVFLLSQINAAKGNLQEAVTAVQYGIQIDPNNPTLYFQLGLLQYNMKNYTASAEALDKALKIQPSYANARYFLGLAQARLGNVTEAASQFAELAKTNPDNKEIALIINNLRSGRPIFTDAQAPVTPNPEKRPSLPIKEKQK